MISHMCSFFVSLFVLVFFLRGEVHADSIFFWIQTFKHKVIDGEAEVSFY